MKYEWRARRLIQQLFCQIKERRLRPSLGSAEGKAAIDTPPNPLEIGRTSAEVGNGARADAQPKMSAKGGKQLFHGFWARQSSRKQRFGMSSVLGVGFVVVLAWGAAIAFWHMLQVYDDEPGTLSDKNPNGTSIAKSAVEPERRVYDPAMMSWRFCAALCSSL
jgi:hypothetical protein